VARGSDGRHRAIEVAARPLRELQKAEHDEIAAARHALWEAEKAHTRAIEASEHELRSATSAWPIAAYGHEVILFEDRLSTHSGNHALTPSVSARVEAPSRKHHGVGHQHMTLVIEEPGWTETVKFPSRDEAQIRDLVRKIEAAVAEVELARTERRAEAKAAEEGIVAGQAERRRVEETRALVNRLGAVCERDEDVLDMAPAISAGHDGVLVATDRRVLFLGIRRTLSFPYEAITAVSAKGRLFGTRLSVSTAEGKGVFSGLPHDHACALAVLVRERITEAAGAGDQPVAG
jgi:hypothetical protein